MFFTGLLVFLICTQFLPWFAAGAAAFGIGLFLQGSVARHLSLATAAGAAQTACAFYQDGRNFSLISQRMSGLFSLPSPLLMFVVMFGLAFITVFLWLRAGQFINQILNKKGARQTPSQKLT